MIPSSRQVFLSSGESLSAAETFEAFLRLAKGDSAFPLLTESDKVKAVISVAIEALEWGKQNEVI